MPQLKNMDDQNNKFQQLIKNKKTIAAALIIGVLIIVIVLVASTPKKVNPTSSRPNVDQIKATQKQNNYPQGGKKISSIAIEDSQGSSPKLVQTLKVDSPSNPSLPPYPPTPTLDAATQAQLQAAIAEQTKVDQEYASWQDTTRAQFGWKKNLPYYGDGYYFYFDLSRNVFIGLLYPKPGQNVEALKSKIITDVKARGVPTDSYTIEWTIK